MNHRLGKKGTVWVASQLVEQFVALWDSNESPPDVFAFVNRVASTDADQIVEILLADQSRRWMSEQPLTVEQYLERLPDVLLDLEYKLQLAAGEFRARQASGDAPNVDAFTSRFDDIGDTLRSKLSDLVSAADATTDGAATQSFISRSVSGVSQVGRYRLLRILGEGAFGRVYLGLDDELKRQVAVKVPTTERFQSPQDAEKYLAEARTVASLDHPNIVPVHDVGRSEDGAIYVVSKFIEGCTLRERIKSNEGRMDREQAAVLIATLAKALHHAHVRRLIHRDVKPSNILLERATGIPYVADFGLAIREEDYLLDSRIAGTPAYMSPEQARGEGHRLDGRSDIFALGVILYQLLTGNRPFSGGTHNEVMHKVVSFDPPNPCSLDASIPIELERICLKAMSKRASDRYDTAVEFAEDLLRWNERPLNADDELQVVPKGLRSFDADDAEFFLELLPGPRNRDGLPDSIQFWKTRIEQTDPDKTFGVGLIYGPSGCGKSSLIKAGLLPRLDANVRSIYLEATPDETEARLLRGLRKQHPEIPSDTGLVEAFVFLRRNAANKTIIFLDQFEQWLHAHRAEQETELVRALRQCDGARLQAVIMVRDDFSMAATRFMRELETRMLEGQNFATVDLFDIPHAEKVLVKFGQAFAKLPLLTSELTVDQQTFITSVASGLAQDGKVVCVRLALFAEMIKGKPWIPATLDEVGGTEGIGANFLEETFGRRGANPEHRMHKQAARDVLKPLLPEIGSDIKGHMRSHAELLEASGYRNRQGEFNDLLRILDGALRLITPTDPEGFQSKSGSDPNSKFYQLTHDYLVPSLRDWLTRKQKETRKGRAELKLVERTALWNDKKESRHLPSLFEWAGIWLWTERNTWTRTQQKMMAKAGWHHGTRVLITTAIAIALVFATLRLRAAGQVNTLLNADLAQLPELIQGLRNYRHWADPKLRAALEQHSEQSNEHLNASLALLPSDPDQLPRLKQYLLNAEPGRVATLRLLLQGHRETLVSDLWQIAESSEQGSQKQLLNAASALAAYDAGNEKKWNDIAERVVNVLVKENPLRAAVWVELLRPAGSHFIEPLETVFASTDSRHSQTEIDLATTLLEEYATDDLEALKELVLNANPKQFAALFDEFAAHGQDAKEILAAELEKQTTFQWPEEAIDPKWPFPSAAIKDLLNQANGMISDHFAFCQTLPLSELSSLTDQLAKSGYRPIRLRPYSRAGTLFVAAAWTRDGREHRFTIGLDAGAVDAEDEKLREEGFAAVDVVGYLAGEGEQSSEHYAVLWARIQNPNDDARVYAGVPRHLHYRMVQELHRRGFIYQQSLQAWHGQGGSLKYVGVKRKIANKGFWIGDQSLDEYEAKQFHDMIAWDVCVSNAVSTRDSDDDEHPTLIEERTHNFSAVWNTNQSYESKRLQGRNAAQHLADCRRLAAAGYRIATISAASAGEGVVTASVWHRPIVPESRKETLARRQANAAVAALRMGDSDSVWPLLKHSRDPRLRTWIVHRLYPLHAPSGEIVQRLAKESDVSIRRALILILGEYQDDASIDRAKLSVSLLDSFRHDSDPGIHSATEWVLKRWGYGNQLGEIEDELASSQVEGDRKWYITRTNRHTMVLLPAPVEFRMGSPSDEPDRQLHENLHLQRINHRFAMATKEVTVHQFQQCLRDNPGLGDALNKKISPFPDCPQTRLTWYEAAAYCRWLSEKEGLPENQMCYPPIRELREGVKLPADYLSRTGYRLPTESEWEFACRANSVTSRFYGLAPELLSKYAAFVDNANDHTLGVGSLQPNDFGLFDSYGNAWEWCQESYQSYSDKLGSIAIDLEDSNALDNSELRVLRGGSFNSQHKHVRSAIRDVIQPINRGSNYGLRPTRSMPAAP